MKLYMKCDRCKSEVAVEFNSSGFPGDVDIAGDNVVRLGRYPATKDFHLCGSCLAGVEAWINTRPVEYKP